MTLGFNHSIFIKSLIFFINYLTISFVKQEQFIHDIQIRKSLHETCKDLVSWEVRNQEFELRNHIFEKFQISFISYFDESSIAKLGIDNSVCKEIATTNSRLLLN